MKKYIYADHAATTQLDSEALEAMLPYMRNEYGNPSTLYLMSREPYNAVKSSRQCIADVLGADKDEIFFTSGGTEADNWAIKGSAFRFTGQRKRIITSIIEHHAVLSSCEYLEKIGFDIIYLPVDRKGCVDQDTLESAINEETVLVSLMMANNEIGTIQNIRELVKIAHAKHVLFHTDAVQAVGHIPVDVVSLGVDMLSASAHKFCGPKGVGFLYVKEGTVLHELFSGGGQENNMRAGTENVSGIVGMAVALEKNCREMEKNTIYLCSLIKYFKEELKKTELSYILNGSDNRIPGSISVSFENAEGEMLLHRLDLMGIAVSTGSACNSKNTELSHVIRAIEVPKQLAYGTIRITLGTDNTMEDVKSIVDAIKRILL